MEQQVYCLSGTSASQAVVQQREVIYGVASVLSRRHQYQLGSGTAKRINIWSSQCTVSAAPVLARQWYSKEKTYMEQQVYCLSGVDASQPCTVQVIIYLSHFSPPLFSSVSIIHFTLVPDYPGKPVPPTLHLIYSHWHKLTRSLSPSPTIVVYGESKFHCSQ